MATKFSLVDASNIRPGDHILEPSCDGSFTAYTVETVERKDRVSGTLNVPRIRFGFDHDRYRYANPVERILVAPADGSVFGVEE